METKVYSWEETAQLKEQLTKHRPLPDAIARDGLVFLYEKKCRPSDCGVLTVSGPKPEVLDYVSYELRHPAHHQQYNSYMDYSISGVCGSRGMERSCTMLAAQSLRKWPSRMPLLHYSLRTKTAILTNIQTLGRRNHEPAI